MFPPDMRSEMMRDSCVLYLSTNSMHMNWFGNQDEGSDMYIDSYPILKDVCALQL